MTVHGTHLQQTLAACLGLVLAAIAVMHPTLAAGFLQDDWTFLAIAQHLQDPTEFYFADQSLIMYHRPHGMLSWWVLMRAFGLHAAGHYMVQILLHAACGLALFWLLERLAHARSLAWAGALVFVLHPATVSTASWLSARFDLMATLGVLMALAVAAGPRPGRPSALAGLISAAFLAAGSKETGLLAGPLVALLMLSRTELGRRERLCVVTTATLPAMLWAVSRIALMGTEMGRPPGSSLLADMLTGSVYWLGWLPTAMALDLGRTGAWVAAILVLLAMLTGIANRHRNNLRRLALGLGLLLAPLLVQWPTTVNLGFDDALSHTANLRLFHFASAGFVLLVAMLVEQIGRHRVAALALAVVAVVVLSPPAYLRSKGLATLSSESTSLAIEASLARSFRELAQGPGCKLWYVMPATVNLPGFADHVAKASLPRGHRALDSLVLSDPMPWHAVVGAAGATPEALFPLRSRQLPSGKEIGPRAIGGLYAVYLAAPDPDDAPNSLCVPLRLRWNGESFIPAA